MMKTLLFACLFGVSAALPGTAAVQHLDEIQTLQGRTYRNCQIKQVQPDGVSFIHSKGAAKILFADLSEPLKKKLGFNEERLAQYENERATRQFVERERQLKVQQAAAEQAKRNLEIRVQILERAAQRQEQRNWMNAQQQWAAAYGSLPGPAPAVGWPGTYYGPLNAIEGPSYGGYGWTRRGRPVLASIGGGSGGYLSCGHPGLIQMRCAPVWTSPTLGSYVPGRFAPFGSAGPFGGVYLGGARNLGYSSLSSVAYGFAPTGPAMVAPVAPIAPVFRGSVSLPAAR
jgi:hypothetical protein